MIPILASGKTDRQLFNYRLYRKIDEGIATKSDVDDIFTDFSNAFEKIDHGLFSQKIYNMGLRG